ncbi:hypothetical protein [Paragemmobacter straminiformis]|uniref:Uncharacterized protein n=1 Tax=Paragemmobacter straminiformis TaxID=2045119 RepID=A0A842I2F1_9RHOB|nr:hypothetical protein [Gemmobacter straminiformis]MBC2834432.1 hypothetical protein [Gemmobacter straminiformis]
MSLSFAQKLGITAVVLGCSTRKELCARFRALNPATEFDLERSFKWLQGKSLPRSMTVYEDWARLLGTGRGGTWLAGCSVEAFSEEVCALFQADAREVQARTAAFLGEKAATGDALVGDFVCYSWAWSPFHQGLLIRGEMALRPAAQGKVGAVYSEQLDGHLGVFRGSGTRAGRTLQLTLSGAEGEHMAQSLLVSGRPSDCFCGLSQGFTVAGTMEEVSVCRIVGMRLPEGGTVEGLAYLPHRADAVAADLAACGYAAGITDALAAAVMRFLDGGGAPHPLKVLGEDLTEVARALALARSEGARG